MKNQFSRSVFILASTLLLGSTSALAVSPVKVTAVCYEETGLWPFTSVVEIYHGELPLGESEVESPHHGFYRFGVTVPHQKCTGKVLLTQAIPETSPPAEVGQNQCVEEVPPPAYDTRANHPDY